jgi:chitodextrinase
MRRFISPIAAVLMLSGPFTQSIAVELGGQEIAKDNLVAWLFIGHSNMAGRYLQSVDFTVDADNIWKLRYGDWSEAREPYSVNPNYGGPCNFFLQEMVEAFPRDQYPELHHAVINNGKTQRKTYHYHAGNEGYEEIMGWVEQYKDEMTIAGMFVLLGYMERGDDYTTFSDNARKVITDFREGLSMPELPVIWGAMEESGGDGDVHRAIQDLPGKLDNVYVNQVRGPCGGWGSDKERCNGGDHHFNWYGYEAWGAECVAIVVGEGLMPASCDRSDTQPPTAPATLSVAGKSDVGVTLEWTPARDDQGVSTYLIYQGDTMLEQAGGGSSSATLEGLSPATQYSLMVKARDCAGNLSAASPAVTFTTDEPTYAAVPLRINVGGQASGDFVADKPYQAGGDYGYTADADNTLSQSETVSGAGEREEVFRSLRWKDFDYTIMVPDGEYRISLLFAEFWRESAGGREFGVTINGQPIGDDPLDVYDAAGGAFTALTVTEERRVDDNTLLISLQNVHGEHAHEPILSGIEITPSPSTHAGHTAVPSRVSPRLEGSVLVHGRLPAGEKLVVRDPRGRVIASVSPRGTRTPLPLERLGRGVYLLELPVEGRHRAIVRY